MFVRGDITIFDDALLDKFWLYIHYIKKTNFGYTYRDEGMLISHGGPIRPPFLD